MNRLIQFTLAILVLVALAATLAPRARADQPITRPTFNVGAGTQWVAGDTRVVLQAEFSFADHMAGERNRGTVGNDPRRFAFADFARRCSCKPVSRT